MSADAADPIPGATRPPLEIKYEIPWSDGRRDVALPFVVAVLADLQGKPAEAPPPIRDRKLREITIDNFDAVLAAHQPRVAFMVPNRLSGEGSLPVEITFRALYDFAPPWMLYGVEVLNDQRRTRVFLAGLRDRVKTSISLKQEVIQWLAKPDAEAPRLTEDATELDSLRVLVNQIAPPSDPERLEDWIGLHIAKIDDLLSAQVTEILHHPEFQRLEGTWRGLWFLVSRLPANPRVKCRVMSVTGRELARDVSYHGDVMQSDLSSVFSREFEEFLGEPVSAIVGDYAFDHTQSVILHSLGRLAAAVHAVFIAAAAPSLFQLDSFAELPLPSDLAKVLATPGYAAWRALRDSECASHLVLALPRMLARPPYLEEAGAYGFTFEEPAGASAVHYTWASPAYAIAERLVAAWHLTGWFTGFVGAEDGIVDGLPVHTFQSAEGDAVTFCPTEVPLSARVEEKLSTLGLAPLVHCQGTDYAAFFSVPTLRASLLYSGDDDPRATRERMLVVDVLARNYFTSTLRAMARDARSRFPSIEAMSRGLHDWIQQYVRSDDGSTGETALRPLRSANVGLVRVPRELGGLVLRVVLEPELLSGHTAGATTRDIELGVEHLTHYGEN